MIRASRYGLTGVGVHYVLLIGAWVAAWLASEAIGLAARSSSVQFIYWTIAKLLIWIAPILLLIKFNRRRPIAEYLWMKDASKGVRTGVVFGLVFAGLSLTVDLLTKRFGLPSIGPPLLNVLVVAPLFEEVVFRGFFLTALQASGMPFRTSNVVAALMFLGMHIPGWYFVGSAKLSQGLAALGILLIGLVAGYARRTSGSLWGSVSFHFMNNLYSLFVH